MYWFLALFLLFVHIFTECIYIFKSRILFLVQVTCNVLNFKMLVFIKPFSNTDQSALQLIPLSLENVSWLTISKAYNIPLDVAEWTI